MIRWAKALLLGVGAGLWACAPGFCAGAAGSLDAHLAAIARPRPVTDPAALGAVEDYIRAALSTYGYQVQRQEIAWAGSTYGNVVAVKKGTDAEEKGIVLVSAHFDSVAGSPGADDNASAVAALLEVARMAAPRSFGKTLKFAALNFEEAGGQGARRYIELARQNGERIDAVINMEMIGFRNKERGSQSLPAGIQNYRAELLDYAKKLGHPEIGAETDEFLAQPAPRIVGDFLAVIANQSSMELLSRFLAGARGPGQDAKLVPLLSPDNGNLLDDTRRSDHAAFWDEGYPALLLTDTAELRNPNYHRSTDTVDTLDMDFLRGNIQAVYSGLAAILGPSTP